jgi:hypothetical protein
VLHAAALDGRIRKVILEDGPASFRMFVDQPLHRNAPEIVIPGVLTRYDIGDLMTALGPTRLTVINPRDATGSATDLTKARNVRVITRAAGAILPIE